MSKIRQERELAQKVPSKPTPLGSDIDIKHYSEEVEEHPYQSDPSQLPEIEKEQMLGAGVMLDDLTQRSGTFIQKDQSPVHYSSQQDGVEVMSIAQALQTHGWLESYLWQAVKADTDKFTTHLDLNPSEGYFIRSLPGVKSHLPVQSCLYLGHRNITQRVHNIIIAEEDSELHIITGCAASPMAAGLHIGISEFYIKRGAKISFTMIHNWAPEIEVRPRSVAIVEESGVFLNNYICMKPVRSLQMYPTAKCVGTGAVVRFNSVLVAPPGSSMDVGSRVILEGEKSRCELITRAITTGGDIIARGDIQGNMPGAKGHLECRGLMLSEGGIIHAIPELVGHVAGVDLSHEAAVGKIAEEEVEYLMTRGITRDEATAMIVRGFLKVDISGLPPALEVELNRAIEKSEKELF